MRCVRGRCLPCALSVMLAFVAAPIWGQTTHNVPGNFSSIQEAILAAVDGDTVLVAPGTYVENIDFSGREITVVSSGGADLTTIDGSACTTGMSTCSVVTFDGGEGPDALLDGFTLTGGLGSDSPAEGGGVYCNNFSNPTLTNLVISDNTAFRGGGVRVRNTNDPVLMVNCLIENNSASTGGAGVDSTGALTLEDCDISGNTDGGVRALGGPLTMTRCVVSDNQAFSGGGVTACCNMTAFISECLITNNTADFGAGLNTGDVDLLVTNSLIANNVAAVGGGALSANINPGELRFVNCTFTQNFGDDGSVFRFVSMTETTLENCIVWDNGPLVIGGSVSAPVDVSYSNFQGGVPGIGNIDVDPQFVDPAGADFHLVPCSPCVDAGNTAAADLPSTDFEGDPRILNLVVDMGIDEVIGGNSGCFIRADSDGDGMFIALLDALHLLEFAFLGGPSPACLEAADADDNGGFDGLVDGVFILTHGFLGGPPPGAPYPSCGSDPDAANSLGCDESTCP